MLTILDLKLNKINYPISFFADFVNLIIIVVLIQLTLIKYFLCASSCAVNALSHLAKSPSR